MKESLCRQMIRKTRHLTHFFPTQRQILLPSGLGTSRLPTQKHNQRMSSSLRNRLLPFSQVRPGPVPPEAARLGATGPAAGLDKQGRDAGPLPSTRGPLVHVSLETPRGEDFSQVYSDVCLGSGLEEHTLASEAQGVRDEPYSSVTSSGNTSPRKWALKSSCRQEARTDSCSESKSSW